MRSAVLLSMLLVAAAMPVRADNCTGFSAATDLVISGQSSWSTPSSLLTSACPTRWYVIRNAVAGRSYSVSIAAYGSRYDPAVDVYQSDGTTLIASNDDTMNQEPAGHRLSRANWIATNANAGANYIRVGGTFTEFGTIRMRIVETTMFCPWWFKSGDYNAFSLVHNTTSSPIHSTWRWRNLSGTQVATSDITVAPNATAVVNARDLVPDGFDNGSLEIAHDGPLDGLVGSTTTLSAGTRLSFDSEFTRRPVF